MTARESIPSPRRILHVHHNADLYGSSRMLLRWLQQMDRRRFEPIVIVPERGPLTELIEREGIEVILHSRLSIISRSVFRSWRLILFLCSFPFAVFSLWRLIRRRRIDLVYTNTGVIIAPGLAAWIAGIPHVWHIREWFQEFGKFWVFFSWYIRTFSRKIITISIAVAGQFRCQEKVVLIHDAFSLTDRAVVSENGRRDFRQQFDLNDQFVVGCVGRIKFVRKGQEVLVQATALLKQRGMAIKALIVGAPFPGNEDHFVRLQQMVDELDVADSVVFAGELANPYPAYAAMDVFAMTSAQPEPFGGVVSEAMSVGVPVIATNIGGSLDQVVDGVTGLLVPPADPAALANAIERLCQNPELRRSMGIAAVDRIKSHFKLSDMAQKIARVFEEAISARP